MLDFIEICAELDRILDLLFQPGTDILKFVIQQRLHHLAPQGCERLVHHPFHRPGFVEIAGDLGAQFLFGQRDFGTASLRQGKHFVLGIGAPFFSDQCKKYVPGLPVHGEAARFGKSLKFRVGPGFFSFISLCYALAFGLEILPVQKPGYFRLQRFRQLCHELTQQSSLAGRQAQCARSFRRIEVVQVAQVGRHCFACGSRLHRLLEQRRTSAADFAQHEQVVIRLIHPEPEAGGLFRARLPDPRQRIFQ